MSRRVCLLCVCAGKDELQRQQLANHLVPLEREGLIESRQVLPGTNPTRPGEEDLVAPSIFVLLLSADFVASDWCQLWVEAIREQCRRRPVLVIRVLLRAVDHSGVVVGNGPLLPRNHRPVTRWSNPDEAWFDVATNLRAMLTEHWRRPPSWEIIDFTSERIRHTAFCGREDVLSQLDDWLLSGRSRGYVLVTGSPGMGKSAILNEWLGRRERAGEWIPHHFLRSGQQDWDQPAAVMRNLAAQIERRFPARRDPQDRSERRLEALLQQVSQEVLAERGERLILLIDGLDAAAAQPGDNPLPQFLPWELPEGVLVLCASRPSYTHLGWLTARDGGVLTLELDDKDQWSRSNAEACRRFWETQVFAPPLPASLVQRALEFGQGNLLYAVKLREQLMRLKEKEREAVVLPAGFEGWLDDTWRRFMADRECWSLLERGLGLLCAAREALPVSVLDELLGGVVEREALLNRVGSVLLPETAAGLQAGQSPSEVAYRLYHDSFRSFLQKKLGGAISMQRFHRMLVKELAQWPGSGEPFKRGYVLRYGLAQRVEAGSWDEVRALCLDASYMESRIGLVGLAATEAELELAAWQCHEPELHKELQDVAWALRAESHWLQVAPHEVAGLVYNRLVNAGWVSGRLPSLSGEALALRLRHPLQRRDMSERALVGHVSSVMACAVSADGRRAVSGSDDRTLKVWDPKSGQVLFSLAGHMDSVTACAISADGRRAISGSDDKTLKVWDLESGRVVVSLVGHAASVRACGVSADGKRAISGSVDRTLKVWDLETGREVLTLAGHAESVRSCGVSADGKRGISGSEDQTLKVWDLEMGHEVFTLRGHSASVWACGVSADGKRAVSGSEDKTLKVWDLETGREVFTLAGHAASVWACGVSADGKRAVSGSEDKTLKVWDLETGREMLTLYGHSASVWACGVSADGRWAVSGSADKTLKVWRLLSRGSSYTPSGHSNSVVACGMSADGRRAVSGSLDKTLKVWDLESGRAVFTLRGHSASVWACGVSADGRRAVSGSFDKTLKVWNLESGHELFTLMGHTSTVTACGVSADGRRAISGSDDKTLKVWDLESGRELLTLAGHSKWVIACGVSADGRRAISGSEDSTLKVWDLESGCELFTLAGHSSSVTACEVNDDGTRGVSGSEDSTLKVWDLESGRELFTLAGHSDRVRACAISADGRLAASGSEDGTLKVWDLDSRECVGTVYGTGAFLGIALRSPRLVAGDASGNVWMLELMSTGSRADGARARGPRFKKFL